MNCDVHVVLGMNRWVLRVAAYAGLMTDDDPAVPAGHGRPGPGTLNLPPVAPAAGRSCGTGRTYRVQGMMWSWPEPVRRAHIDALAMRNPAPAGTLPATRQAPGADSDPLGKTRFRCHPGRSAI